MASQVVQQGNLLQYKVIALSYQLGILLQECQSFGMRFLYALIELVQLHEHAGIRLVQMEGLLHVCHRLVRLMLLVEAGQRQVTPYGGELRIEFCRQFPVLYGKVILTLVVVEASQIVRRLGTLWILLFCSFQGNDSLQSVGETIVSRLFLRLLKASHIIIGHRTHGTLFFRHLPYGHSLIMQSGLFIVQCQFLVVLTTLTHQHLQRIVACKQELLITTAVVKVIQRKTILNPCQSLLLTTQQTQHCSLQRTCLVIATIEDERTVQLVERIVVTLLGHTDTSGFEVTGVCPRLIPGRLPEQAIGLVCPTLVFQCQGEVEKSLTIIGIRITFLPYLHSPAQTGLCLVKTTATQIP